MNIGVLHREEEEAGRLSSALSRAGYRPTAFTAGTALADAAAASGFDLLVMRWDGADLCGVALMHRLRARMATPPGVILLLDEAAPGGIAEGADAVLPDPCSEDLLGHAIKTYAEQRGPAGDIEHFHGLSFDHGASQVIVRGHRVLLTAKEFSLALLLLRNQGQALSREQIMASVWGRSDSPGSRTLDAHVAQVRKRLMLRPEQGWRLSSVYGFGYRLDRADGAA